MTKPFIHYHQHDQMDCGPTCLRMVAKYYNKSYTAQTLRDRTQINREGVSLLGISEAAESIGFKTIGVKITLEKLIQEAPLPCIIHWGQNHFVVLYKITVQKTGLASKFLSGIRGGRKPQVDPFLTSSKKNQYENILKSNTNDSFERNLQETDNNTMFHVADPATGLMAYSTTEFGKKWLSNQIHQTKEGIALLLEPTSRFYMEEGEKQQQIKFSQLINYLWQYKKLIAQLGLGMLLGSGLALVLPLLTQSVVDVGIGTQNLKFINLILIAQTVLLVSTAAVDFIRGWILLHISTRLNLTILSEFLSKLLRLPLSFFDSKQFGDIMQRIGDHQRIESFLTGPTLNIIFSLFNLLVFGFILVQYKVSIFLVAVLASVLYTLWVLLFLRKRRELDLKRFEVSAQNQSHIVQLITGMQEIKLAGAETIKRWEWERIQAKLFKWSVKSLSLSQFQQGGALLINNGKNLLITFLAAKAVVDGELTLGAMVSVQFILGQFNAPIEQMIGFLQSWQDAQISLERLNEVHKLKDEEPFNIQTRKHWDKTLDILVSNLSYTYPGAGSEPSLRNVSLLIPNGKTTAIVGPSGSGKTTLLKMLLRFYEPQSGSIILTRSNHKDHTNSDQNDSNLKPEQTLGLNIKTLSHSAWRQECGVVMQEGFLFSDTIARNIAVAEQIINEDKLYQAAISANIHDFIETLPLGYHTKIGAEGSGISQGQKQRILIARAIYKNPFLLLLDEATNSLDSFNEARILKNLENFTIGKTVVVVAHRLSTVKNADQILVMDKGEIVEKGTHTSLLNQKGKYYELVSNQLELNQQ